MMHERSRERKDVAFTAWGSEGSDLRIIMLLLQVPPRLSQVV